MTEIPERPSGQPPAADRDSPPAGYFAAPSQPGFGGGPPRSAPPLPPLPGYSEPVSYPQHGWSKPQSGPVSTRTTRSTWVLTLGLLGLGFGLLFGWGFPLAIIALVLYPGAFRTEPAGISRARAGRICAILGLAATVIWASYSVLAIIPLLT